jgi:hypothetical protein
MLTRRSTAYLVVISTYKLTVDQFVYIIAFEEYYDIQISLKIRAISGRPP